MTAVEFHPLANIFPLIEGEDFADLVADIRGHGCHEPIVIYEDKILDGRNRYRACVEAGVEPKFMVYSGDDAVAYVISLNLRRRHLSESQRAMVAAKLATMRRGDNQHSPIGETSQARAAELLNVGKRSVERAADVREGGTPELVHAVEQGAVSVSAAADVATLPAQEQREIVARGEKEILQAAALIRARKAEFRHAERITRLIEISKRNTPLGIGQTFPVIYADPPWRPSEGTSSPNREIENQYPTMTTEAICALPVSALATEAAVLFLWSRAPNLPEALQVMAAWGFEYATSMVWVKHAIGTGYWVRNRHELLLIGSRGGMPHPAPSTRPDSVIEAPRREHSRKPDEAYALIEQMYPELPKIELFARQTRPGWQVWGNQVRADTTLDDGIPDFLRRTSSAAI
jgi:N6-adenosine-specific RNA methylase IME4/ParB-like chromosome segregation protein Spo0J